MEYTSFLESKRLVVPSAGKDVPESALHPALFPFQRSLIRWSLRKGRSALFASTGLGKTFCSLEWARLIADRVLILAPLAVALQTVGEGARWGIPVTYARNETEAPSSGITITNYERLERFNHEDYEAVVLDESSILRDFNGKTRTALIEAFRRTPYRLCCTATPAPNDIAEIANHAEMLGVMSRVEMLAAFFVHDDSGWRLKGHARAPFYRWLASWGMSLTHPSDLGFSDSGYDLPPLAIEPHFVETDYAPPGQLFTIGLKGIGERAAVRRDTIQCRIDRAAELITSEPERSWIAWVGLDEEGRRLAKRLPGSLLVEGSQSPEVKAEALTRFARGEVKTLVTKARIAGLGLNLQTCARMVFVGLSDSYEAYYQAIRRCWRFGQTQPVTAHIVLTEPESVVYENVLRKEREAEDLRRELIGHVSEFERAEIASVGIAESEYRPSRSMRLPEWLRSEQSERYESGVR